jgi:hypothetical protein
MMQARYVLKMGNCWFHCVWIEICIYILGNTTHTSEASLYILLHRELWFEIRDLSSETTCTSPSVLLQPLLLVQSEQLCDGLYYLTKHVDFKVWVKMITYFLYNSTINSQNELYLPNIHIMIHFLHITAYFSEYLETSLQEYFHWHLLFKYTDHLVNIYSRFKQQMFYCRAISDSFILKMNITRHFFIHNSTHYILYSICHTKLIYIQEYLLHWQLVMPNTLCIHVITYIDAKKHISHGVYQPTCMCNLHSLDSIPANCCLSHKNCS